MVTSTRGGTRSSSRNKTTKGQAAPAAAAKATKAAKTVAKPKTKKPPTTKPMNRVAISAAVGASKIKNKLVFIEACKQWNAFKTRAHKILKAVGTQATVLINQHKVRNVFGSGLRNTRQ